MKKKKPEVDNKQGSINVCERETARILIIDDEKPILDIIGRLLKMNGYSCDMASGAQEARSIMNIQDFDLVLCDVNMPGERGTDFIKYLSESYPETAFIMVTGEDDKELAEASLDLGA